MAGKSQVHDRQVHLVVFLFEDYVLRLDVPVHYAFRVHVVQRLEALEHDGQRLLLSLPAFIDYQLEQIMSSVQFAHEIDVLLALVNLVQLQNAGVVHGAHHLDLLQQPPPLPVVGHDQLLVVDFDSEVPAVGVSLCLIDLGVVALAQ